MELLTSPGGVNGSTPDRALLAAQIRASFESLVRASPSPMVRKFQLHNQTHQASSLADCIYEN